MKRSLFIGLAGLAFAVGIFLAIVEERYGPVVSIYNLRSLLFGHAMVSECEVALLQVLASPSSYQRISADVVSAKASKIDYVDFNSKLGDQKVSDSFDTDYEKTTVLIRYDAVNSHGALSRDAIKCEAIGPSQSAHYSLYSMFINGVKGSDFVSGGNTR